MTNTNSQDCFTFPITEKECIIKVVRLYISEDKKIQKWIEYLINKVALYSDIQKALLYQDLSSDDTTKKALSILELLEHISISYSGSKERRKDIAKVYSQLRDTLPLWLRE